MQSEFRFTTPFNVRVEKKGDQEEIHLDGFISTTDRDLVDDVVTKNCLESMKQQIIEKNLKLDIEHEAFRGSNTEEKEINKSKIPVGRMYDAAVETIGASRFGLRVKSVLNNFYKNFDKVKGSVEGKFLDAYSIAFLPKKTSFKEIDGKTVRLLDEVTLLNVALTGNPINTTSQNRKVFMKAIESVDDYKKAKEDDPEIQNKLHVKSIESKPGDAGYVNCPECGAKVKYKKTQSQKQIIKSDDNKLNKGGKIMDQKDQKPEDASDASKEPESTENQDSAPGENPESGEDAPEQKGNKEEDGDGDNGEDEEIKSLRKEIKSLKSNVEELKEILKKPNLKGRAEQRPKQKQPDTKSKGPLDHL